MTKYRSAAITGVMSLVLCVSAYGDGISVDYFLRFHTADHSPTYIWTMIAALMVTNYVWNFIVIGWPTIKFASVPPNRVAVGLIGLTLLGQIADRTGAFLAFVIIGPFRRRDYAYFTAHVHDVAHLQLFQWMSQQERFLGHLVLMLNFVFSGVGVALLAWFFLRRWSVPRSLIWKVALAAGVFTNPAWAIAIVLLRR